MSTYQSFQRCNYQSDGSIDDDDDNTHEAGVLIHVPESDRCKCWKILTSLFSVWNFNNN